MLVETKVLSRQTFCCDKHTFVATKDVFCRDKSFDAIKMILVAAPPNDRGGPFEPQGVGQDRLKVLAATRYRGKGRGRSTTSNLLLD